MVTTGRNKLKHNRDRHMSVSQAYASLGLDPTVDLGRVHATYRKLALKHHPDRNPGDPASLERFKELNSAYRVLQHKFRMDSLDPGRLHGDCDTCGAYDLLRKALDGSHCCAACLSRANRWRLLPSPPIVIATCATSVVLLILAAACLLAGSAAIANASLYYGSAFVLGLACLGSLAATCMIVVHTADPQHPYRTHSRPFTRVRRRKPQANSPH